VVFERIFLPIVDEKFVYKEAKASEVPMDIGTENERKYHILPGTCEKMIRCQRNL
jgi:hypothetical protein